ncbi:MAG: hypothetical protein IPM00_09140 [Tetrasphaera sp.]|nr:hypothetical protein [Tetrasphaera sp.]
MSRQSSVTIAAMSRSWPTDLTEAQRPCVVSNARGRVVVSSEPDWVVGDLVRVFGLEAWLGEDSTREVGAAATAGHAAGWTFHPCEVLPPGVIEQSGSADRVYGRSGQR